MTEEMKENEMMIVVGGELEVGHVIESKLTVEKDLRKSLKIEIEEIDQTTEISEKGKVIQ